MFKKLLASFLIFIVIILSLSTLAFAHTDETEKYPFIFVHGLMGWGEGQIVNDVMPYWGTTCGDMMDYLENEGYEVHAATVGGANSAWDRACELYAQLTGTRVDYGEAHAAEHGHSRFGRTYDEPICSSFGETKINLVGHSFGGATVRLFASILEYGAAEEVAASGNGVSDFFKGGKGEYIHSITTLSAPHNGSLAADRDNVWICDMLFKTCYYGWGILDNTPLRPFWDMQLEQFGLTDYPDDGFEGEFNQEIIDKILASEDTAYYDLTLKGAAELNEKTKMLDNVYYFSYSTECVFEGPITGRYYPEITMNPLFVLTTSPDICTYDRDELFGIPVDESWRLNDGVVSTKSAMYPEGEPHKDFDGKNIEKGIWNVMPVMESTDHTDFMGMFYSPFKIRKFYSEMCSLVCSV